MLLNLGCGKDIREDCLNVDDTISADRQVDLAKFPWPWPDNSVDGIYASHIMEHIQDQERFIDECRRILKMGGFLRLNLPHASSVSSVGCIGHYRTYSYSAMTDYLDREGFYLCPERRFETTYQRLNWWYEKPFAQEDVPMWMRPIIKSLDYVLTRLANLSPKLCENVWCFWVGGMREVIWEGKKV
jgi:predicted SAM-dependent methyltransferase